MESAGRKTFIKRIEKFLPYTLLFGLITLLIGIIFVSSFQDRIIIKDLNVDYTHCNKSDIGEEKTMTCLEYLKDNNDTCVCFQYFNIPDGLEGNVTFYYELETFNQLRKDYVNSRDNKQLKGIMNKKPSPRCEPYVYDLTLVGIKPIAPCGAIANAMFTDTYRLKYLDSEIGTVVPTQVRGMLSEEDRVGFQNPENMSEVMENFTKPRNWNHNISELDPLYPDNNGFQNEYFIAWMRTDWQKKPWAILNRTEEKFRMGLPEGQYELRVAYRYPTFLYHGPRKVILASKQIISNEKWLLSGVISTCIGMVFLIISTAFIYCYNYLADKEEKMLQDMTKPLTLNETSF